MDRPGPVGVRVCHARGAILAALTRPGWRSSPWAPRAAWEGSDRVRALLSVSDREGISAFARELLTLGHEVYATDGTR